MTRTNGHWKLGHCMFKDFFAIEINFTIKCYGQGHCYT